MVVVFVWWSTVVVGHAFVIVGCWLLTGCCHSGDDEFVSRKALDPAFDLHTTVCACVRACMCARVRRAFVVIIVVMIVVVIVVVLIVVVIVAVVCCVWLDDRLVEQMAVSASVLPRVPGNRGGVSRGHSSAFVHPQGGVVICCGPWQPNATTLLSLLACLHARTHARTHERTHT